MLLLRVKIVDILLKELTIASVTMLDRPMLARMDQIKAKDDTAVPSRVYSSAPSSRCNSLRNRRGGSVKRDKKRNHVMTRANSVSLPDCTDSQAGMSLPLSRKQCPLCTVRSFKTTSKGIIDSGSFSKSLSSNSLLSSGSLNTSHGSVDFCSRSTSVENNRESSVDSADEFDGSYSYVAIPSYFRTLVLGAQGVGKTSLVQQLTRCESLPGKSHIIY